MCNGFMKRFTKGIHTIVIIGSLYSFLALAPQFWIPIVVVSVAIHFYFKDSYLGFYYERAEKMDMQIIPVGPEEIKDEW
jgi:hypothetical protein